MRAQSRKPRQTAAVPIWAPSVQSSMAFKNFLCVPTNQTPHPYMDTEASLVTNVKMQDGGKPEAPLPLLSESETTELLLKLSGEDDEAEEGDDDDVSQDVIEIHSKADNGGNFMEFPEELMTLAAFCRPPQASTENETDSHHMARLADFIACVGGNRLAVRDWNIFTGRSRNPPFLYVANDGTKLKGKAEVCSYLKLGAIAFKMAEMSDYMDERNLPFFPSEWRVDERRKADGKRSGFMFVSQITGKTFYARNRVADFIESYNYAPLGRKGRKTTKTTGRRRRQTVTDDELLDEEEDEDSVGESDGENQRENEFERSTIDAFRKGRMVPTAAKSASTTFKPNKRRRKDWKVGDAIVLDYEGQRYNAIIVHTPKGRPTFDVEEEERMYTVWYVEEQSFEHDVLESRIVRDRISTKEDARILEDLELMMRKGKKEEKAGPGRKRKDPNAPATSRRGTRKGVDPGNDEPPIKRKRGRPPKSEAEKAMTRELRRKSKVDRRFVNYSLAATHYPESEEQQDFFNQVKLRYEGTKPGLFWSYVTMIREFRGNAVTVKDMKDFIVNSFGVDDVDLCLGFNMFLPQEEERITPYYIRQYQREHKGENHKLLPSSVLHFFPSTKNDKVASAASEHFLLLVAARFKNNVGTIEKYRNFVDQMEESGDVSSFLVRARNLFRNEKDLLEALTRLMPNFVDTDGTLDNAADPTDTATASPRAEDDMDVAQIEVEEFLDEEDSQSDEGMIAAEPTNHGHL